MPCTAIIRIITTYLDSLNEKRFDFAKFLRIENRHLAGLRKSCRLLAKFLQIICSENSGSSCRSSVSSVCTFFCHQGGLDIILNNFTKKK